MKYSFKNDYSEMTHPTILEALTKLQFEQFEGYGQDRYSEKARKLLKTFLHNEKVDIHFVTGGTQANLTVIASLLKPYEAVISVHSWHICVHEAGAIEANGNKIITVDGKYGKIYPEDIQKVINLHTDEHMVIPKLVFISNSTETGTIYTKKELISLSSFCKKHNLLLYLDGARLGVALTAKTNDIKIEELCKLVDILYIGGTKNGAILGEAIIIINDNLKAHFRHIMKQKGALLAKSTIIGIQFCELFNDGLYFKLAENANDKAMKLAEWIEKLWYTYFFPYITNQIFPILPNDKITKLQKKYDFYIREKIDEKKSAIRLVTSRATKEENIVAFLSDLQQS